jgi:hypothetical protein
MSEIKHTPGPWTVMPGEINKPYLRIRGTRLGQRYKIANVLMPAYPVVRYQEADETHANARLIAAAPELLEALEFALHELEAYCYDESGENYNSLLINAAIAKATGNQ